MRGGIIFTSMDDTKILNYIITMDVKDVVVMINDKNEMIGEDANLVVSTYRIKLKYEIMPRIKDVNNNAVKVRYEAWLMEKIKDIRKKSVIIDIDLFSHIYDGKEIIFDVASAYSSIPGTMLTLVSYDQSTGKVVGHGRGMKGIKSELVDTLKAVAAGKKGRREILTELKTGKNSVKRWVKILVLAGFLMEKRGQELALTRTGEHYLQMIEA